MLFHDNRLLADDSYEISYLIFLSKLGKMSQNLSSAAVVICALRVNTYFPYAVYQHQFPHRAGGQIWQHPFTHIGLTSYLWDTGKQCRSRSDAADKDLHCLLTESINI